MIAHEEFEILEYLERNQNQDLTQRTIAEVKKFALGKVNSIINILIKKELIEKKNKGYVVSGEGYEELKPYKVKRAIFIAAGFGSRLVPITLNTPKPLILVKGRRIIETLLDAVIKAGIEEIYIVRGYLKEQFDVLLNKYPQINFIDNPIYNESNNISSIFAARHLLSNSYVFESDLLLANPLLIRKYEFCSNYLGIKKDIVDDWCFYAKSGFISKVSIGGKNCFQMVGISYWSQLDGEKLAKDVNNAFHLPGGKEKYWDQVPLESYISNYHIFIRTCDNEDITEIDTFAELKKVDGIYDV